MGRDRRRETSSIRERNEEPNEKRGEEPKPERACCRQALKPVTK
jgi:hypothetical protein